MSRSMSPLLDEHYGNIQHKAVKIAESEIPAPIAIEQPAAIAPTKADRPISNLHTGQYGTGQNGGEKWFAGMSNSGASLLINHTETRQNGRMVFHRSTQARTLITRKRDITVDVGLKLEPTPMWELLGITQEAAEDWANDHEQRFHLYMSSKQAHHAENMTGYQLQRLCSLFRNRDNDQFIRYFYSKSQRLMSPVQIDFIDPNQIQGFAFTDTYGFQNWQDGIKRDAAGKETHYKVVVADQTDGKYELNEVTIPARGTRSGRIFMSHMFEAEYAGQVRGYSPLHYAVQDLQNLTDFSAAEIKKAINQSTIAGFVKPSDDAPASNPLEDALNAAGGSTANITDDNTPAAVSDTGTGFNCSIVPEYSANTPGSLFVANLNAGEEITFPANTSPGPQFDNFITSIMTYLASAYSMPLEVVAMKFGQNYSASRAALLLAWATGKIEQAEIDADLMNDWWEMWLSEEIAAGRTQAPGWSDPRLRRAWMAHRLQGPPLPSINPRDDRGALEVDLRYGITTPEAAARQINGSSAKSNIAKNTKTFPTMPALPGDPVATPENQIAEGVSAMVKQQIEMINQTTEDE